jgi:hypothetical protein
MEYTPDFLEPTKSLLFLEAVNRLSIDYLWLYRREIDLLHPA